MSEMPPAPQQENSITMSIDGEEHVATPGESVAARLLAVKGPVFRHTSLSGTARGVYCGMGACYDCLVCVDQVPNTRSCVTIVRDGMEIRTECLNPQNSLEARPRAGKSGPSQKHQTYPLVVIGAGPAGLAAALTAHKKGLEVAIIDSNPQLGGQYFKQVPAGSAVARRGSDRPRGADLIHDLECSTVTRMTDTMVWGVFPDQDGGWLLSLHGDHAVTQLRAESIVIATGAYDRPLAFPGWTLPGVMTAGAVHNLLRAYGVLPGKRFLFTGSGPLQLVVAAEICRAGGDVVAVLEANPGRSLVRGLDLPALRGQGDRLREGWKAWRTLKRAGVPLRLGRAVVSAYGQEHLQAVELTRLDERWFPFGDERERYQVDVLVCGYGFLPSTQITRLLGCQHQYDWQQGGWIPVRDEVMQTTIPGIFAVGDGAGVQGAAIAQLEGRIAGLTTARRLADLSQRDYDTSVAQLLAQLRSERRFATLLASQFTPRPGLYSLATDDTIICRCEEVPLSAIRDAQACGCHTLTEIKGVTRAGMGNCQGRICGDLLAQVLMDGHHDHASLSHGFADRGFLSVRPPIHPLTLADLAEQYEIP